MSSNGSPYDTIDGYGGGNRVIDRQRMRDWAERINREGKAQHQMDLIRCGVVCKGKSCNNCRHPKNCINDLKWAEENKDRLCYFICKNYKCPEVKRRGYYEKWGGILDDCEFFDNQTKMCKKAIHPNHLRHTPISNLQLEKCLELHDVINCSICNHFKAGECEGKKSSNREEKTNV